MIDQATVPVWLTRGDCHYCKIPFEGSQNKFVAAVQIYGRGAGDVLFLHPVCSQQAIKP